MRAAQPGQRGGDVSLAVDEAAEVGAQPHEAAQLDVLRRCRQVANGSHLARVHGHARRRYAVAQGTELLAAEGALGGLQEELLLPQDGENIPDVL